MMSEKDFQKRLAADLKKTGINAVDLSHGTFDLLIEGVRPFVCEMKLLGTGVRGFQEDEEGFVFTEDQTKEILKMKFPPFVVVSDDDKCYFLPPDWVKREVEDLKEFPRAIMMKKFRPFPAPMTYGEALRQIIAFVTG